MEVDFTRIGYDGDKVDLKVFYLDDDQSDRLVVNVFFYFARGFRLEHHKLITHPSYQPSRKAMKIAEPLFVNLIPSLIMPTHPNVHTACVKELRELFPISDKNPNGHCWFRLRLCRWRSTEGPRIYMRPVPKDPSTSSFWV